VFFKSVVGKSVSSVLVLVVTADGMF